MPNHTKQQAPAKHERRNNVSADVSLVEALRNLVDEMSRASTEAEAEDGIKRLKQIRISFLGSPDRKAVDAARRDADALIAWVESRLEQLRQQLAQKRRIQEGEVMELIAKQREAEGPALLPTELIDAVVRSTTEAERSAQQERHSQATAPDKRIPEKRHPGKQPDKATREEIRKEEEPQSAAAPEVQKQAEIPAAERKPEEVPAAERKPAEVPAAERKPAEVPAAERKPADVPAAEQRREAVPVPNRRPEAAPEQGGGERRILQRRQEAPKPPAQPKSEWTKFERLVAHMAASVREDPLFFEKLRKAAKRNRLRQRAPEDDRKAEQHFRSVHDLGKRLINLELKVKALAAAEEKQERASPLLRSASKELKSFLLDLKAGQQAQPEMAGEYDRLFGGYAEQFASMKPEKGKSILAKCREERQPVPEAAQVRQSQDEAAVPEVPQLVRRRNDWGQS